MMRATIGGLALLALAACGGNDDGSTRLSDAELRDLLGPTDVTYEVDGSASSANVTYETPTGTSQGSVDLPMRNKLGQVGLHFKFEPGAFLYISAQNDGEYGDVTCRIKVDGEVVSENTATGDYAIATCKG